MFDYMVKIMPNSKVLVRNLDTKESLVIGAKDLTKYFEQEFKDLIASDEGEAERIEAIKKELAEKGLA